MAIDNFPYARLGLDQTLEDVRRALYQRLTEVHAEYAARGWLPAALNLNRGPARGMLELANWGLHQVNQDFTALVPQCFAGYASGSWLDLHAADVLLERKPALQATGAVTFSRKEPGGNVKIPAGRLVRTRPDGLGERRRFVTTADAVLPEGALEVDVPVIAEDYGAAANVTVGTIVEIVTAVAGLDAVTNAADWLLTEGVDEEDDEALRYRYYLQWKGVGRLNRYFYESRALSVAGVTAVQVHDRHPRGQGTVDVYVKGAAGLPTPSLLEQVAAVIDEDRPQLDDVLVLAPQAVPVDLDLVLEITSGNHEALKLEVENRLRALFASPAKSLGVDLLKIGEDLTHSRLHSECLKSAGIKRAVINSPADDVQVAAGQLAVLESLAVASETAEE